MGVLSEHFALAPAGNPTHLSDLHDNGIPRDGMLVELQARACPEEVSLRRRWPTMRRALEISPVGAATAVARARATQGVSARRRDQAQRSVV